NRVVANDEGVRAGVQFLEHRPVGDELVLRPVRVGFTGVAVGPGAVLARNQGFADAAVLTLVEFLLFCVGEARRGSPREESRRGREVGRDSGARELELGREGTAGVGVDVRRVVPSSPGSVGDFDVDGLAWLPAGARQGGGGTRGVVGAVAGGRGPRAAAPEDAGR